MKSFTPLFKLLAHLALSGCQSACKWSSQGSDETGWVARRLNLTNQGHTSLQFCVFCYSIDT